MKTTQSLQPVTRRRLLQTVGAGGVALALGVRPGRASGGDRSAEPEMRTRLTESFGLRHAFVGAGMGFVALPALVAAVSEAGATVLFPGTSFETPGVPMPTFSALPPTPDTTGNFDAMGLPAGEGAHHVRDVKPVARIVADMMEEARLLLRGRLA